MGERLAALCAAVEVAGKVANQILKLGWDVENIVDIAFDRLTENRKASSAEASITLCGSWFAGREAQFKQGGERPTQATVSLHELPGRFLVGRDGVERVAVLPDVLKKLLAEHQYEYNSTLAQWNDRQWLDTDTDRKRNTKKVSFQGRGVHMVVLNPAGMAAALGDADAPTTDELIRLGYETDGDDFAEPSPAEEENLLPPMAW